MVILFNKCCHTVFQFSVLSSLVSTATSLFVVLVVEFIIWKHPQEQQAVEQHETNNNTESTAPNQRDNAILGDEQDAVRLLCVLPVGTAALSITQSLLSWLG